MSLEDIKAELIEKTEEITDDIQSVINVLEEALSGTSPKSKNTLIKTALQILKG